METLPLVRVTARINDQHGRPVAGALVTMKLTTPEKYQGLVVPRETKQVTDALGVAVLRVFPNALGHEGSEYAVRIAFPGPASGPCGCPPRGESAPVLKTIRAHAVVPNTDCNLFDIINLPPYEQRGAGELLPEEVAGYAARAATSADMAKTYAEASQAVQSAMDAKLAQAEAARTVAQSASDNAEAQAARAQKLVDGLDQTICNFEITVTDRVEKTAAQLTADAVRCIKEQEAVSLEALTGTRNEALKTLESTGAAIRSETVSAVTEAGTKAVQKVNAAADQAVEELREIGSQFEEDFLTLTERAESAAKRAACSAAGAAQSATKACLCADRAEAAAQGLERHRDEALAAAKRAETAQACAEAAAQRSEAAADMAQQNADYAAGSAKAAQEAAKAADASADLAKQSADMALAAQQATAADRAYVQGVAEDVKQAVHDVAVDLLTPQVITDAVNRATKDAQDAADAAKDAAAEAQDAVNQAQDAVNQAQDAVAEAQRQADRAEAAGDKAASILSRMADAMTASWVLTDAINEGELLELPGQLGYFPGHHALSLSWDGLACYQNRQWEEVGAPGALSRTVRLLFSAPVGSEFEARIAGHADAPDTGGTTLFEERLIRVEADLATLAEQVVYAKTP